MRHLKIQQNDKYSNIYIGETLSNLNKYLPQAECFYITDQNIFQLYSYIFPETNTIVFQPGEEQKNLNTVTEIIQALLSKGADRNSFIVGVGGGVVTDITGFVASVFMRGIPFGFVSTSLLSMVDAAIGGKNGVNFLSYKNIIGAINQPEFVICDIETLKTLPEKEIRNGWGEIFKHALISDTLFNVLAGSQERNIFEFDSDFYFDIVDANVRIKAEVVQSDVRDKSQRKTLNLGHTLGHAIEQNSLLLHGEAVVAGMLFSLWWSKKMGFLPEKEYQRGMAFLSYFNLKWSETGEIESIVESIGKDKKKNGNSLDFVFLERVGKPKIVTVTMDNLLNAVKEFFNSNLLR